MDKRDHKQWDFEAGSRIQERGQFYSVTLAFTLLALTVQSAQLTGSPIEAALEALGTLSLIISGGAGLWRIFKIPGLYKIDVHIHSLQENIDDAHAARANGESVIWSPLLQKRFDVDYYIDEHDKGIAHFRDKQGKLERNLSCAMHLHKISLLAGVLVIAISRVLHPAAAILWSAW